MQQVSVSNCLGGIIFWTVSQDYLNMLYKCYKSSNFTNQSTWQPTNQLGLKLKSVYKLYLHAKSGGARRTGPGRAARRLRTGAGRPDPPGPPAGFGFHIFFNIFCIYFDIFWYILYILLYFWYIFAMFLLYFAIYRFHQPINLGTNQSTWPWVKVSLHATSSSRWLVVAKWWAC